MRVIKFLFSGTFMGILLIVFAISMGYATFIENDFGTATAKLLVYDARWFEIVMALMVVNFTGMIFTRQLYRKSKINILFMHLAFVVIIIGAGITRYIGYEGVMHIREGETSNEFLSSEPYVHYQLRAGEEVNTVLEDVILAPINKVLFSKTHSMDGKDVNVAINRYLPNAQEMVHPDESGEPYLNLLASAHGSRMGIYIKEYETKNLGGLQISFQDTTRTDVLQVKRNGEQLFIRAPYSIMHMNMASGEIKSLEENQWHKAELMNIYTVKGTNFVIREFLEHASVQYVPAEEEGAGRNVVEVKFTVGDESKTFTVPGGPRIVGNLERVQMNGVELDIRVGSRVLELPFSLKLNDFVLDRYPGSQSPSSFASEITLIDQEENVTMPYRIFMNNVLQYEGFRFYQSSYDNDERGTVLSVNHDRLGTIVTYTGYFLLFATLIISLFTRKTRFAKLRQQLDEIHVERKKLTKVVSVILLTLLFVSPSLAQNISGKIGAIDARHADQFGKTLVQSRDGRIIPVNTSATNILVKIYKKSSFQGVSANQVILGMMVFPEKWKEVPMIKVYDESVQEILGINGNFASFNECFDARGHYKLRQQVNDAYAKSPAQRNQFDKEIIYVDERMNVAFMAFNGSFLTIYPVPDHPEDKWVSPADRLEGLTSMDSAYIKNSFMEYINGVKQAVNSGDYNKADAVLSDIQKFQRENGEDIIPKESKISLEVWYNKMGIFKRLFPLYMTIGMILLGMFLLQLFKPSLEYPRLIRIFLVILGVAFLAHTVGLAIRWYISGHAPWSNGYESMIYIAWATMLAGFLFLRKSAMTLSVTSILAGITLLTAHMSWMNPEITNLVPVLKSYWLTLHVSTITASYGFLGLGSMLGFLNLSIMIFRTRKNQVRVNLTLQELTYIIEMSLMVGLILLAIGNFLGGIWANESWGRYWGWDPKETWSLITIIVYSFILHMRLIPGMKSLFSTNFGALIGFGSVLMTYFGVNYYLSGLHSYAQGDPVPVPTFVYYVVFFILLVGVLAAINDAKMNSKPAST